jgi:hypothetical protein
LLGFRIVNLVIPGGLYFFIDWHHGKFVGEASGVTALTFILMLLLNANWFLASAEFFLDRFRIPVLVPLALLALISGNNRASDHYFHVETADTAANATGPGEILRVRMRQGKPIRNGMRISHQITRKANT